MRSPGHGILSPVAVGTARVGTAWRGLLLVSLAGVLWGTIGPGVVFTYERSGLAPLTISAYRALFAVAALLCFALATGQLNGIWASARPQWRRVAAVGVLTATFQMLFFVAVVVTGVSVTTVVCLGFAPVLLLVLRSSQQRRFPSARAESSRHRRRGRTRPRELDGGSRRAILGSSIGHRSPRWPPERRTHSRPRWPVH